MSQSLPNRAFQGKWITTEEFFELPPRNVFFRQLTREKPDCSEHRDRHILFRRRFSLDSPIEKAILYVSADDYYKLYINGVFVTQGPTPSYHFQYNYNTVDVAPYLKRGENVIALHTLYHGVINRTWQSGDNRHGLLLDLEVDGRCVLSSDESFRVAYHTAYRELGVYGNASTGFLEEYDSRAPEVGFERPDFDDGAWEFAKISQVSDHVLRPQATKALVFETIAPIFTERRGNCLFVDFGSNYAGHLLLRAKGAVGDAVTIRMGQELWEDGSVRYQLRANCVYEDTWILGEGESVLDPFDYKAFRYAELILPAGCELTEISLIARHYPFSLAVSLREDYAKDPDLARIWELCVHTQEYGTQEAILDCMDREKGFYLGDGCYTALTQMLLTGDDSIVRMLIDDAFSTSFVSETLMTCMNCSFMQEIAEYPLMMVKLILWHYRLTEDKEYLATNYPKVVRLLDAYRRNYGREGLLCDLDKWCVVEWPANFRDGYDVDLKEGQICKEPHVALNAYYLEAVGCANHMAAILSLPAYRETASLEKAFLDAFYLPDKHLFRDGVNTQHVSMIGNVYPFAYGLCPDEAFRENMLRMIEERKISAVSLFGAFAILEGLVRCGEEGQIGSVLLDEGAWLRMLREDATTTFEGWGKETKKNASLFHMTMSYAAAFLADTNLKKLFLGESHS